MAEINDGYDKVAKEEFDQNPEGTLPAPKAESPELVAQKADIAEKDAQYSETWHATDPETGGPGDTPSPKAPAAEVSAPAPVAAAPAAPKTYSKDDFRAEFKAQRAAGAKDFEWRRADGTKYRVTTLLKSEAKASTPSSVVTGTAKRLPPAASTPAPAPAATPAAAPAGSDKVEPRGNWLTSGNNSTKYWDEKYGKTHNPDGTPIGSKPAEPVAAAAPALPPGHSSARPNGWRAGADEQGVWDAKYGKTNLRSGAPMRARGPGDVEARGNWITAGPNAMSAWDKKYGATHDEDGFAKAGSLALKG